MKCTSCSCSEKRRAIEMMILVLFSVAAISFTDWVLRPEYMVKSLIKIVLFFALPMLYSAYNGKLDIKTLFGSGSHKKGIGEALLWGTGIFILIIGAYITLGRFFDFSGITINLETEMGINKNNFVYVAVYISFANSFLEEFFFRGFSCLKLQKYVSRKAAYLFSSIIFALYHVAMMAVAFEPALVIVSLVGLVVGGIIFNYFNEKYGNIYISWLIHMGANFAINGIAMTLFGII